MLPLSGLTYHYSGGNSILITPMNTLSGRGTHTACKVGETVNQCVTQFPRVSCEQSTIDLLTHHTMCVHTHTQRQAHTYEARTHTNTEAHTQTGSTLAGGRRSRVQCTTQQRPTLLAHRPNKTRTTPVEAVTVTARLTVHLS